MEAQKVSRAGFLFGSGRLEGLSDLKQMRYAVNSPEAGRKFPNIGNLWCVQKPGFFK
jgi:hypothetical protein